MDDAERMEVERVVREAALRDEAGRQAAAEPLPGALRDAFAAPPDITAGPYKVRPFYDVDFEAMSQLAHPLADMMRAGLEGRESKERDYIPRGPHAWELAWLLTRSPDDVDATLEKHGPAGVKRAARREFGRIQLPALNQLSAAVLEQMRIYWSPALEHGAPDDGKNKGGEQRSNPIPGAPSTASAGSLKSDAGSCAPTDGASGT